MKKLLFFIIFVFGFGFFEVTTVFAASGDDFVITVKTDNPGTSTNTQFTIPTIGGYDYNVDCDNDGIDEGTGQTSNYTCNYSATGTYTVRIKHNDLTNHTGFPRIYFNNAGDKNKLLTIEQRGTTAWISMSHAFQGCSNLQLNATDTPDLSNVTKMQYMFSYTDSFTGNSSMNSWNTSGVVNMRGMFKNAASFNQDISSWNTLSVTNMRGMFYHASSFNQNLSSWNVSLVTNMTNMFFDVALSTSNYDSTLIGRDAQTLQTGVNFHGGNSTYGCAGKDARAHMISSTGDERTIIDGGFDSGTQTTRYRDADGDGYGDPTVSTEACSVPSGYTGNNADCDDITDTINPGATEICDGLDNNCDGNIDEGVQQTYYADNDGDGYGDSTVTTGACFAISGYVAPYICSGTATHDVYQSIEAPLSLSYITIDGQVEMYDRPITFDDTVQFIQDKLSNHGYDANVRIDSGATVMYTDIFGATAGPINPLYIEGYTVDLENIVYIGYQYEFVCVGFSCYNTRVTYTGDMLDMSCRDNSDCDDTDDTVYSGAEEICDGKDNNCDGVIDEGFVDTDNDGIADCVDTDDDNDGVIDSEDGCPLIVGIQPTGCPSMGGGGGGGGRFDNINSGDSTNSGDNANEQEQDTTNEQDEIENEAQQDPNQEEQDDNQEEQNDQSDEKDQIQPSSEEKEQTKEYQTAYEYAYSKHITTLGPTIDEAYPQGPLLRKHLAKMMVNFALNELGRTPHLDKGGCNDYDDIGGVSDELHGYIVLACQLEIMGMKKDGITPLALFMPEKEVSVAEFGTVLSRVLWGRKNDSPTGLRYENHLKDLKAHGYYSSDEGPRSIEKRENVRVALMRIAQEIR